MVEQRIKGNGSAVIEAGRMGDYTRYQRGIKWYRSKDRKAAKNPFGSYMINKKWSLEEEFNNHMLRFQQVTVRSLYFSKLHLNNTGWIVGH